MIRNSTFISGYRKLAGDARQRKGYRELTFERLPEICGFAEQSAKSRRRRIPAVIRAGYKIPGGMAAAFRRCCEPGEFVSMEGVSFHEQEWYRVRL